MSLNLLISAVALQTLRAIPKPDALGMIAALKQIAQDPANDHPGVKRLVGQDYFSFQYEQWRAICLIDREASEMMLEKIRTSEEKSAKEILRDISLPAINVENILNGANPVRAWREARSLTAIKLAENAGLARGYLSEIETAKKPGSVLAYKKLANALRVSVDDLVE